MNAAYGFIDDVEWVLEQTPDDIQIALFSATMPSLFAKLLKNTLLIPNKLPLRLYLVSYKHTTTFLDGQWCPQVGRAYSYPRS